MALWLPHPLTVWKKYTIFLEVLKKKTRCPYLITLSEVSRRKMKAKNLIHHSESVALEIWVFWVVGKVWKSYMIML